MTWIQKSLVLRPMPRGFHLITNQIREGLPELTEFSVGLLNIFLQHTSASLTLTENADPDVRSDLETSFSAIAPESFGYTHTCEGPDDMPAHVKCSLLGASLNIPINEGEMALGTWQGITLCEHRNRATSRRIVLTLQGQVAEG